MHYEIKATRKILKEAKDAAKDGTVTKAEAREAVRKVLASFVCAARACSPFPV